MSLRDIIIALIVLAAGLHALRRPWIGVMLWTWVSTMNPHRYAWGFIATAPVAAFTVGATLLGLAFTKERRSPFLGLPVVLLAIFVSWMTVSWLMSHNVADGYWLWNRSMKIFFMAFITLMLLQTKEHIMTFAWIMIGSLAMLGAKGGAFTLATLGNYRVWGPPDTFIEGNNEFALALIIIIPLIHFLQLQVSQQVWRHILSIVMLLCVIAAFGSHSRGALVAIIAMSGVFWWRSPNKGALAILFFITAVALLPMLPEHWWTRMQTISEYQVDASAIGRLNAWHVAWEVAKHELFGAGMSYQYPEYFFLYGKYETIVRAAHSIYFEILGNHGFIGLFLFLLIWITTFREAGWLMRNARSTPHTLWAAQLGAMAQVSLVGYAVGGAFLSLAYFDLPYNILIMVMLAKTWVMSQDLKDQAIETGVTPCPPRKRPAVHQNNPSG